MKTKIIRTSLSLLVATKIVNFLIVIASAQPSEYLTRQQKRSIEAQNVVAEMQVACLGDSILLRLNTNAPFNGMVYAKDAPASVNCMSEFNSATNMTFRLPLKSCGTLSSESDDGIEYFNTVVVQPHMRLMTNQGKGYHIRCKYQTRERTIANTQFNVSASFLMQDSPKATTPLLATASMPSCTMKIFRRGRNDVAETVKIGDKLVMVIEIDQQDMYGMRISNCVVRDGMNMSEQQLIDTSGCPVDETIMPSFEYSNNNTRAAVSFPAHKFPHTSSVYYQCNVSLCINNGNCHPVECPKRASGSSSGALGVLQAAASTPAASVANASSSGSQESALGTQGSQVAGAASSKQANSSSGSRRKRYATVNRPGSLEVGAKPSSSKLISARSDDMSFDVYSGLNVDDLDASEDLVSLTTDKGLLLSAPKGQASREVTISQDEPLGFGSEAKVGSRLLKETDRLVVSKHNYRALAIGLLAVASLAFVGLLACQLGLVSSRGGQSIEHLEQQNAECLPPSTSGQTMRLPRSIVTGSGVSRPHLMGQQQQHCWRFDSGTSS